MQLHLKDTHRFLKINFSDFYFMCMGDLPACMFVNHVHIMPTVGTDPPELALQMVVSYSMDDRNRTQGPVHEQPELITTKPLVLHRYAHILNM